VYIFPPAMLSAFCWHLKPWKKGMEKRHGKKPRDEGDLEKGK